MHIYYKNDNKQKETSTSLLKTLTMPDICLTARLLCRRNLKDSYETEQPLPARKKILTMEVWEIFFLTVFNSVSLVVGGCANLLIIISFFLYNSIREATGLFLVSLSVADLLVCVVFQPLLIYRANHPAQDQLYKSVMSFFGYGLMLASLNGLLAVTSDRFVSIYLPFKYVYWMTERNAARIITVSWLSSIVFASMNVTNITTYGWISNVYTCTTLVLVSFLYSVIYREAMRQARRIAAQCPTAPSSLPNKRHPVKRATIGIAIILTTTVVCWLPMILLPVLWTSLGLTDENVFRMFLWSVTASSLNSCVNPFLYVWQFSQFRCAIKKLFREIQKKHCAKSSPQEG